VSIEGSVALVTGGASGLGEATARHLVDLGAQVVIYDRDEARGGEIVASLGPRARLAVGDVTSEDDTLAAIAAAEEMGPLRYVVACAGGAVGRTGRTVGRDGTPAALQGFADTVTLNLVGSFNTLRLAAAAMARHEPDDDGQRGAIVLTASIAGFEGQIGQIAYGSAKAGIIGMTLIAARDLAAVGVRVNTIAPGTMFTRAWDQAPESLRTGLEAQVPNPQRFGRPEEFAALAEHLLTNGYLNGEVVRLDGGIRFSPK
jgi:NAD(P)-dependent dehydrogenase (short-subunit alcohol dehydrogenase family)